MKPTLCNKQQDTGSGVGTRCMLRERSDRDSVQAWNEAMKDVFTRFFKKMAGQVCTVIIV